MTAHFRHFDFQPALAGAAALSLAFAAFRDPTFDIREPPALHRPLETLPEVPLGWPFVVGIGEGTPWHDIEAAARELAGSKADACGWASYPGPDEAIACAASAISERRAFWCQRYA